MVPEAVSEEASRTGTRSNDEAEWLLRVLPVLEADSRLKDMVSSSLVDWASRTTCKTNHHWNNTETVDKFRMQAKLAVLDVLILSITMKYSLICTFYSLLFVILVTANEW